GLMVGVMVRLAAGLIWALGRHDAGFRESVATATAGIVTLIPEGLVLLTSLTFAVAAMRLSRKGMLVQYMNAIESLANVDTVCLDKTGTLTDGNLVLYGVDPLAGAAEEDVRSLVSGYAASAEARNSTLDAVAAGLPGAAAAARAGVRVAGTPRQGRDLPEDPAQLADVAREATVFARLTPDNKRALIAALTGHGAYVAMIGDGVNDVPAMKGARLAVALGSGTQLAKSVADSVLVADRFGAIPDAVGEGRKIINNVQRVAKLFVTK